MPRNQEFNREEVVQSAKDLFWDQGYHGTSMADLVAATGLNRSSLYNSFGNKMSLYKTVLIQYQEENRALMEAAIEKAQNSREAIQNIFTSYIEVIVRDIKGRGCFGLNCLTELSRSHFELKDYLEKTQESTIDMFQDLVQNSQNQGFINQLQSSSQYAQYLHSAYQGLRMTGILTRNRNLLEHIVRNTLDILK